MDGPPPKGHVNALKQLESADARSWAKKLGVKNVYDTAGRCVRCHAAVVSGDAAAGVTCESCHGPGRGYAVVHQDKGAYANAVAALNCRALGSRGAIPTAGEVDQLRHGRLVHVKNGAIPPRINC